MTTAKLEEEYQRLIQDSILKGTVRIRQEGPEKRHAPRFQLESGQVAVKIEPSFEVLDVSASGMAFQTNMAFLPGKAITLVFHETMGVQAHVIACEVIETDPTFMEAGYRVQCHFENPDHGKQVLITMKITGKLQA